MPTTGYQNTTRISIHPFERHFKSGNNEGYVETGLRSGKGMKKLSAGGGASLCCLLLLWVIYSHRLREGKCIAYMMHAMVTLLTVRFYSCKEIGQMQMDHLLDTAILISHCMIIITE